jgi:hypothetical protein
MMTVEIATHTLAITGLTAEGLCVASFLIRGKVQSLPLVFSYLAYLFTSDALLILLVPKSDSWPALVITTRIGYFLEFAAVLELAYNLLEDTHAVQGLRGIRITAIWSVVLMSAAILIINLQSYGDFGASEQSFLQFDLFVSILRALAIIAIMMFLGLRASGPKAFPSLVTLVFAAYAICDLVKHIVNELDPWLQLPPNTFEFNECACGFIWVFLMAMLSWKMLWPLNYLGADPRLTASEGMRGDASQ